MYIYLDIDPPRTTAQQKGIRVDEWGHVQHYTKAKVRKAHDLLFAELLPYRPAEPWKGPVYLSATYAFKRPKGEKRYYKVTRPDADNMQKLLKDVMTECGFWVDDAQVVVDRAFKCWSGGGGEYDRRGIYIYAKEMRDPPEPPGTPGG